MLFKHFCVYYLQNCILFAFLLDISMDVKTQNQSCLRDLSRLFGKERGQPFHSNKFQQSRRKLCVETISVRRTLLMCDIRID